LGVMISSGNIDSMVAHYTVAKRRRQDDAYSPGNKAGLRPDRAVIVYANCIRRVFGDIPLVIGGLEASLRRFAHYDYWDDKVRRSVLFDSQADLLTYGMGEKATREIAARLVYELLRRGGDKVSFDPVVAAGANGSRPHAVPGDQVVDAGMFITMDFGCKVDGYCSDMTRTVALGQPTEEMERVYSVVLAAQRAGINAARAGVAGREVDAAARQVIAEAGYGEFFSHSFGHSLGLDIHESPNAGPSAAVPLPVGAVISAEPGIYLPGRFGVRIEDVLILKEGGCENITRAPKDLIVL
ncbi:MAG: M24 family metallopeptidase, partial [Lawsonibacter sp.]